MTLTRVTLLAQRRIAARKLGVPFSGSTSFVLPRKIRLSGHTVSIRLPTEIGVKVAFIELLLDDCYQLRRLIRLGEAITRVIDVGANVGLFGLAARNAFHTAVIHAYEPNRALEPYLSEQCRSAGVEVFYEAVGREADTVTLDVINAAESVHTASRSDPAGTIPQIALRTAIERIGGSVDLLKIDCEGSEWEMLAAPASWRSVRYVTMEYHLREGLNHDSIGEALRRCGFLILDQNRAETYGLVFARNEQFNFLHDAEISAI